MVRRVDRPTCWSPPDVCLAGNLPWRDSPRLEAHQMVAVGCHAGMRASLARGPVRTGHVTGFRACIVRCTLGWRVYTAAFFFFSSLFVFVRKSREKRIRRGFPLHNGCRGIHDERMRPGPQAAFFFFPVVTAVKPQQVRAWCSCFLLRRAFVLSTSVWRRRSLFVCFCR